MASKQRLVSSESLFSFWHVVVCLCFLSLLHRKVRAFFKFSINLILYLARTFLWRIVLRAQYTSATMDAAKLKAVTRRTNSRLNSSTTLFSLKTSSVDCESFTTTDGQKCSRSKPSVIINLIATSSCSCAYARLYFHS